ncbi:hypothetical protein LJC30_04630 [Odoribacter sp. OttesenSCG-928-L07]|nr:hypothetical protein [Odoribacter sp. OttesenSCG-928-L07]MDL2239090.1 hypothetical protein [Bacteroidales bacterium OttesenSCG-928-L14]MDL2240003.1 hypothetical protein [Bacteroidales bacterium OttesenSCG-928-K22]
MKKFLLICTLLFVSLAIYSQDDLRNIDIKGLLSDTSLTPEERLDNLNKYSTKGGYYDHERDIPLFYEVVFPFIDKEIKESSTQNFYKTIFHHTIACIYRDNAMFEKQGEERAQSLKYVEKAEDDDLRAYIYHAHGQYLIQSGDIKIGHEYMYKSTSIYEELGKHDAVILNLINIAMTFSEIYDDEGLNRIIKQIENYPEGNQMGRRQYIIYMLKKLRIDIIRKKDPDNKLYRDSAHIFAKKLLFLRENYPDEIIGINHISGDYYNLAVTHKRTYPEDFDSTRYYLNKALEHAPEIPIQKMKLEILVYILSANLNFEQEKYEHTEKDLLYTLSLLEELKDRNDNLSEFNNVYQLFVDLYEKMNNPAEALKYQKLLQDNAEKRYDNDKIQAINDMSVKYETEKKEAKIAYLELKNQTARRVIILVAALLILLIIAVIFIVINNRLRKKNLEQSIYETALLSELQQTELEKTEDEKQLLQQEYDKLSELAGESQKKAEEYAAQLQSIKQQLEQKPTQSMANKIKEIVSKSLIDNYHKKEYIENLSKLDIDMLEQGFLTADEKISNMDMKYIICFAADMEVKDISLIFNVEPASVRTVRYRIKKKFQEKNTFKFLI